MLFGFPLAVMSDDAASLKGDVDALLSAGGVKRLFSIPYLPRTNGKSEAAVQIIANGITKLAMDPQHRKNGQKGRISPPQPTTKSSVRPLGARPSN